MKRKWETLFPEAFRSDTFLLDLHLKISDHRDVNMEDGEIFGQEALQTGYLDTLICGCGKLDVRWYPSWMPCTNYQYLIHAKNIIKTTNEMSQTKPSSTISWSERSFWSIMLIKCIITKNICLIYYSKCRGEIIRWVFKYHCFITIPNLIIITLYIWGEWSYTTLFFGHDDFR